MRRIAARLTLAGLLVAAPSVSMSQTNINQNAQFSSSSTVLYLPFTVTSGGAFDMYTSGLNHLDPMLLLFEGTSTNGSGLGVLRASNDDGGMAQLGWNVCTGAGGTCHSRIFMPLATGDYTLAYGIYNLTETEARNGSSNFGPQDVPGGQYPTPYCNVTGDFSSCNYDVHILSQDGTVAPEPASITLMATGLLGLFGVALRKRNARIDA
jgi:hypothetical protein